MVVLGHGRQSEGPSIRRTALAAWERAEAGTDRAAVERAALGVPEEIHANRRRQPVLDLKNAEDEAALQAEPTREDAGTAAP